VSDGNANITDHLESPAQMPAFWVFLPGLVVSAFVLWTATSRATGYRMAFELALLVFVPDEVRGLLSA